MQLQKGILKDGIDFLTLDTVEITEFGKNNHSLKSRCNNNYTISDRYLAIVCCRGCRCHGCRNFFTFSSSTPEPNLA